MKPDVEPTIEDLKTRIQELEKETANLKTRLERETNARCDYFNDMCQAQSLNNRYLDIIEALAKPKQ